MKSSFLSSSAFISFDDSEILVAAAAGESADAMPGAARRQSDAPQTASRRPTAMTGAALRTAPCAGSDSGAHGRKAAAETKRAPSIVEVQNFREYPYVMLKLSNLLTVYKTY